MHPVIGEMNALGKRIEWVDSELKQEEQALKEANEEISEISKELNPLTEDGQTGPNGESPASQPGDERLEQIEGLKSRLELIKAMYGLSSWSIEVLSCINRQMKGSWQNSNTVLFKVKRLARKHVKPSSRVNAINDRPV